MAQAVSPSPQTARRKGNPMTTAHTPGPWRVFDVFTDIEIVTDCPTAHETESLVQFKGQRNAKANARLMAAAPDLKAQLEHSNRILKEMVDYTKRWSPEDIRLTSMKMQIEANDAAITKATV
jgi:hypothetical protein